MYLNVDDHAMLSLMTGSSVSCFTVASPFIFDFDLLSPDLTMTPVGPLEWKFVHQAGTNSPLQRATFLQEPDLVNIFILRELNFNSPCVLATLSTILS